MSTRLWLLLAFVTPNLCRQRSWTKRYPFNPLPLRLCWPRLWGSCKRDRDTAQVKERLGGFRLQAALGQGKEQALSKVLLLPQPGLLSWSCTHLDSLRAAAAPDRADGRGSALAPSNITTLLPSSSLHPQPKYHPVTHHRALPAARDPQHAHTGAWLCHPSSSQPQADLPVHAAVRTQPPLSGTHLGTAVLL